MNKEKVGDLISLLNKRVLRLAGKNLPTHVGLKLLNDNEAYEILDKSIFLASDHMKTALGDYQEAMDRTNMAWGNNFSKQNRHSILHQLLDNVLKSTKGNSVVAECGCFQGQSAFMIASIIKKHALNKRFFIFDSFEGLSEYSAEDHSDGDLTKEEELQIRKCFAATEELVRHNLRDFNFIEYYKGWIPERFNEVQNEEFCFVNIDVDLYDPIKECLSFFYPRLVTGGVLFLDDYGFNQFPGAITAVDEFVVENKPSVFIALPTGGAFIIK